MGPTGLSTASSEIGICDIENTGFELPTLSAIGLLARVLAALSILWSIYLSSLHPPGDPESSFNSISIEEQLITRHELHTHDTEAGGIYFQFPSGDPSYSLPGVYFDLVPIED